MRRRRARRRMRRMHRRAQCMRDGRRHVLLVTMVLVPLIRKGTREQRAGAVDVAQVARLARRRHVHWRRRVGCRRDGTSTGDDASAADGAALYVVEAREAYADADEYGTRGCMPRAVGGTRAARASASVGQRAATLSQSATAWAMIEASRASAEPRMTNGRAITRTSVSRRGCGARAAASMAPRGTWRPSRSTKK